MQKISAHHCLGFCERGKGRRKGNCSADAKRGSRLQLFKQWCLLAMPSATEQSCFPPLQQVNLKRPGTLCTKKCLFIPSPVAGTYLMEECVCKYCKGSRTSLYEKSGSDVSAFQIILRWTGSVLVDFFLCGEFNHPLIIFEELHVDSLQYVHVSLVLGSPAWTQKSRCTSLVLSRGEESPPITCWESSVWSECVNF